MPVLFAIQSYAVVASLSLSALSKSLLLPLRAKLLVILRTSSLASDHYSSLASVRRDVIFLTKSEGRKTEELFHTHATPWMRRVTCSHSNTRSSILRLSVPPLHRAASLQILYLSQKERAGRLSPSLPRPRLPSLFLPFSPWVELKVFVSSHLHNSVQSPPCWNTLEITKK